MDKQAFDNIKYAYEKVGYIESGAGKLINEVEKLNDEMFRLREFVRRPHRIREYRENAGLTLREVSEATKISISHLSDIEHQRGVPSHDTLNTLMDYFGIC